MPTFSSAVATVSFSINFNGQAHNFFNKLTQRYSLILTSEFCYVGRSASEQEEFERNRTHNSAGPIGHQNMHLCYCCHRLFFGDREGAVL